MPLLNGTLELHDIKDAEKFCRHILDNHLRRTRAALNPADQEDALAYLVETCWELSTRYDTTRSSSFSKYAYNILQRRIIDWYRSRYYRDQTSTDWYRKRNPDTTPPDPEQQRNFHFPASLDAPDPDGRTRQPAAPDHSGTDPVDFAQRTRNGDPLLDCDPDLYDALNRRRRKGPQPQHLRRKATPRRAA